MKAKSEGKLMQIDDESLSQFLNQIHFKINAFGLWESDEDKEVSYTSDDFEIIYYVAGGSETTIGIKQYECVCDSLLLVEPYGLNHAIFQNHEYYAYYYIHFEIQPYHLQRQLLQLLSQHGNLLYADEFRYFKEMFARMLMEVKEREIGYTSIVQAGLLRVIVEMIRAQHKRSPDQFMPVFVEDAYVKIVNDAITYLKDHLQYSFKQDDLAKAVGVSTSYLYKAFQKVVATSPTKYVQQYKIMRSQKLLMQNYRVNDIAAILGYSSAYHFSKVFKDMTQMSPKQYKQQLKNRELNKEAK